MRYAIPALTILLIFSSCSDNSKSEINVYKIAEEGLLQSNKNIDLATNTTYKEIQEKVHDPVTREIAIRWQSVANEIKQLTDSITKYMNGLKTELKNKAGGDDIRNKNLENDRSISEHFFKLYGKGKELLRALIKYKEALFAVDPEVKSRFEHSINIFSNELNFTVADTISFTKTFFSNIPVIAANVTLSKFINSIKLCENETATFCYNHIGMVDGPSMYNKFTALIGQSSNCVKASDTIEISAGIGSFSTSAVPSFTVDDKVIKANEEGIMVYKFKTQSKAGTYSKPVTIEYTKPDGTRDFRTYNISYTVIEPNQE